MEPIIYLGPIRQKMESTFKAELPRYAQETAFYRVYLGIDPQTGRDYLAAKLFAPDALTGTGKALFRIDGRAISKIKKAIARYRKAKKKVSNVR